MSDLLTTNCCRYVGARPLVDLYNKKASLKLRRTDTGKNLSCLSVGVMCSNFLLPDKILAARLRAN